MTAKVITLVRCVTHGSEGLAAATDEHCPQFDGYIAQSCISRSGGSLCGDFSGFVKTIRPELYLIRCHADSAWIARSRLELERASQQWAEGSAR